MTISNEKLYTYDDMLACAENMSAYDYHNEYGSGPTDAVSFVEYMRDHHDVVIPKMYTTRSRPVNSMTWRDVRHDADVTHLGMIPALLTNVGDGITISLDGTESNIIRTQ